MSETLLILVAAYVFLTALLLLLIARSPLPNSLKFILLLLAPVFYWCCYQGWKQAQGWPATAQLPAKFLLHYAVIEEPDKETATQGNVYLWLSDLANDTPADKPRSYRIEYSPQLHSKVQEALRKISGGELQLGTLSPPAESQMKQSKARKLLGANAQGLQFVDLPDPALPEK